MPKHRRVGAKGIENEARGGDGEHTDLACPQQAPRPSRPPGSRMMGSVPRYIWLMF